MFGIDRQDPGPELPSSHNDDIPEASSGGGEVKGKNHETKVEMTESTAKPLTIESGPSLAPSVPSPVDLTTKKVTFAELPPLTSQTIVNRLHALPFWKQPDQTPRQQRMVWASPIMTPSPQRRSSSLVVVPGARTKALVELVESLQDVAQKWDHPSDDLFRSGLVCGVPYSEISADEFEQFKMPRSWFSISVIHSLCLAAECRLARIEQETAGGAPIADPGVKYVRELLPWHMNDYGIPGPLFALKSQGVYKSVPWRSLGEDASWRERVTVGVISVAFNCHFVCVAIFGPARLVVPFDGSGGSYDHPEIRSASVRMLRSCVALTVRGGRVCYRTVWSTNYFLDGLTAAATKDGYLLRIAW